jgi:putative transposase
MRNLAAKVPEDLWPEFKARAAAAYQAPSRKIARELADGLVADYGTELVNATACFMDDFEACRCGVRGPHSPARAHLRRPITHRRATRTTNLLERLFVEERRRLKIIPNAFGQKAVLKLRFGAMTRAAERWRSIRITAFERRQMAALRRELDQDDEATVGLDTTRSKSTPATKIPSRSRT